MYVVETGDLRRMINNHRFTIKTKRVKEPVAEHFIIKVHSWKGMTVVVTDHNTHWTDADKKSKTYQMLRLRSFRPAGINKFN